ncbi:MAG: hypothetical protein HWQ41_21210 [Nostoc sp. NOS(2021)]|uniref:hypothetical protein n=1 Tax=Nostoc sp. NOS(2021) TaxID=2815407 RepID=UPI0025F4C52F|nr:hypothetical protein [Nostoc sp. NOS(2021)]MBN3897692.1 hypothetical protein [Nostoc sp. NOS(2021)]
MRRRIARRRHRLVYCRVRAIAPTFYFLCISYTIAKGDRTNGLLLMHFTYNP